MPSRSSLLPARATSSGVRPEVSVSIRACRDDAAAPRARVDRARKRVQDPAIVGAGGQQPAGPVEVTRLHRPEQRVGLPERYCHGRDLKELPRHGSYRQADAGVPRRRSAWSVADAVRRPRRGTRRGGPRRRMRTSGARRRGGPLCVSAAAGARSAGPRPSFTRRSTRPLAGDRAGPAALAVADGRPKRLRQQRPTWLSVCPRCGTGG